MHWYVDVLKNYATFSGRARRQEYWMFTLVNSVIAIVLAILYAATATRTNIFGIVYALYMLAVLIPSLAVVVRRLHDTGRSGWWFFISLIPLIGTIILLVYLVSDSEPGENAHGPSPKQVPGYPAYQQ